jgi:hypothetical protein
VKNSGSKKESSNLNSNIEKLITLLKNIVIDDKEARNPSVDIIDATSEQKKVRESKFKKELLLSKIETKSICSLGLPMWQENKLQKLSAERS